MTGKNRLTTEAELELKQMCLEANKAALELFDKIESGEQIIDLAMTFDKLNHPAQDLYIALRVEATNELARSGHFTTAELRKALNGE